MRLQWDQAFEILDQITKTGWGSHTRDVEIPVDTYMSGASLE